MSARGNLSHQSHGTGIRRIMGHAITAQTPANPTIHFGLPRAAIDDVMNYHYADCPHCAEEIRKAVEEYQRHGGKFDAYMRCGAYAEHWKILGKPEGWLGCSRQKGHTGNHEDEL